MIKITSRFKTFVLFGEPYGQYVSLSVAFLLPLLIFLSFFIQFLVVLHKETNELYKITEIKIQTRLSGFL